MKLLNSVSPWKCVLHFRGHLTGCRETRIYILAMGCHRDKAGSLREQPAKWGVLVTKQLKSSWITFLYFIVQFLFGESERSTLLLPNSRFLQLWLLRCLPLCTWSCLFTFCLFFSIYSQVSVLLSFSLLIFPFASFSFSLILSVTLIFYKHISITNRLQILINDEGKFRTVFFENFQIILCVCMCD